MKKAIRELEMVKVALVRCESYEYEVVMNAVNKGINLLEGV